MLIYFIVMLFLGTLNALTWFLPIVTELPFGLDGYLSTGMGYLYFIMQVFPPFAILYQGFLAVIAFKVAMFFVRFIPVLRHMWAGNK